MNQIFIWLLIILTHSVMRLHLTFLARLTKRNQWEIANKRSTVIKTKKSPQLYVRASVNREERTNLCFAQSHIVILLNF